ETARMTMKKLKKLFAMGRADRELDAEMRFHLEKQIELNMAAGMSAEEARRQAMILFGSLQQTKEATKVIRSSAYCPLHLRCLTRAMCM
ncbi:MAG TPA: permease prefix domain 1-containing protein, partial [Alphaproteobacteria bacterium]|nr:permease prefix domain 1-containing protein [Alphaproteobacteria bacterium]